MSSYDSTFSSKVKTQFVMRTIFIVLASFLSTNIFDQPIRGTCKHQWKSTSLCKRLIVELRRFFTSKRGCTHTIGVSSLIASTQSFPRIEFYFSCRRTIWIDRVNECRPSCLEWETANFPKIVCCHPKRLLTMYSITMSFVSLGEGGRSSRLHLKIMKSTLVPRTLRDSV